MEHFGCAMKEKWKILVILYETRKIVQDPGIHTFHVQELKFNF